jgi:2-polyprenyl-6-hydroxyphenyl methylase/3-demethylubiquinone-9 3-methyltransferase
MSKTVERFFDNKARPWSAKYSRTGPLAGRLLRFEACVAGLVVPPARILDVGCGTGELASRLSSRGFSVTGCDISARMLERAQAVSAMTAIEWVRLDCAWKRLPFADVSFNVVTMSSVLEYINDLSGVVQEIARVLRPGGVLVVTVPDTRHVIRRIEALLAMALRVYEVHRLLPLPRLRDFAEYLILSRNRLSLAKWVKMFQSHGLSLLQGPTQPETLALLTFRRC